MSGYLKFTLFLITACYSVEGLLMEGNSKWLHRKESISKLPLNIQRLILDNTLKQKNLQLTGNVPKQIEGDIPDIIEYLVNGRIDVYLTQHLAVGPILGPIVKGGISLLKSLFGGGKAYLPNMPPVIDCPDNIETIQDRGRLTAVVTWKEPKGYDAEDGVINNVQRNGKAPGSRFSGETIIQYSVADSKGRTDFCTFAIKVAIIKCHPFPLDNVLINSCGDRVIYYGGVCHFSCPAGYTLKGRSALNCNIEGQFDGQRPDCEHTGCSQPQLSMGGSAWDCSNTYKPRSVCRLKCEPGYQTARSKDGSEGYIQCAGNGSWTGTAECIADVGAIMGAINGLKHELQNVEKIQSMLMQILNINAGNTTSTVKH